MVAGTKESEIAAMLELVFRLHGAEVAFPSIVASGPSAATLHYEKRDRQLRKRELLLIDCGAEYEMYAGDITRMFPIGGRFEPHYRELHSIVLAAQLAAISKVKDGVLISKLYDTAAMVLTQGLVDLGVLRGRVSVLFKNKHFKPFFPHGIGHSLGLDVHDVGKHRANGEARLRKGMVFTIEPGLYFSKRVGRIPACGVRIEDDILVTSSGCEVLSAGFPKEPDKIEEIMRG